MATTPVNHTFALNRTGQQITIVGAVILVEHKYRQQTKGPGIPRMDIMGNALSHTGRKVMRMGEATA
jgi:hypothetical protein